MDTMFAKPSILRKPLLQQLRNQSVVRQPTAFKSERTKISKPQFSCQVDVEKDLPKPVTTYYLPKEREYAFAKPHYLIASSESRINSKNMPRFSSNDMVHNRYLEEARKKTQERIRNSKPMNSRAKIQSHKTRNSNKLVEQKSHTQNPGRQIFTGHKFSPNKSFVVFEKTSPRSCLRWKPTSRILKTVGLRWVPTRHIFAFYTSKADNDSTHGSNVDISKIRKCKQTLDLSAADISETSVEVDLKLIRRMTFEHNSSSLDPQCQKMMFKQNGSSLAPQRQQKFLQQI
ncbi:hypothetical protein Tco_1383136 [Tanacetum coccineum]